MVLTDSMIVMIQIVKIQKDEPTLKEMNDPYDFGGGCETVGGIIEVVLLSFKR